MSENNRTTPTLYDAARAAGIRRIALAMEKGDEAETRALLTAAAPKSLRILEVEKERFDRLHADCFAMEKGFARAYGLAIFPCLHFFDSAMESLGSDLRKTLGHASSLFLPLFFSRKRVCGLKIKEFEETWPARVEAQQAGLGGEAAENLVSLLSYLKREIEAGRSPVVAKQKEVLLDAMTRASEAFSIQIIGEEWEIPATESMGVAICTAMSRRLNFTGESMPERAGFSKKGYEEWLDAIFQRARIDFQRELEVGVKFMFNNFLDKFNAVWREYGALLAFRIRALSAFVQNAI